MPAGHLTGVHGRLTRSSCLIEPETTGLGGAGAETRRGLVQVSSFVGFKFQVSSDPARLGNHETGRPTEQDGTENPCVEATRLNESRAETRWTRKRNRMDSETRARSLAPTRAERREAPRFRVPSESPGLRTLHSAWIKLESARRSIRWHSRHNVLSSLSSLGLRLARARPAGCV